MVSISSKVFSMPEILSSVSAALLALFAWVAPDLFPRFSISSVASIYDFLIVSISIFRTWTTLFNYFTCLIVFSYISLRDLFVSSLRASTRLPVFWWCLITLASLLISLCLPLTIWLCLELTGLGVSHWSLHAGRQAVLSLVRSGVLALVSLTSWETGRLLCMEDGEAS